MPISQFNNWNAPLARFGFPGDVFDGAPEPTGTASAISVNILCSTLTTLTIQQSYNTSNFYYQKQYVIQGGQLYTIQMPVVLPYFRVTILNEELVNQTYCNMNTSLVPQLTQSVDIRHLDSTTDSVSVAGTVDLSGSIVDVSGTIAVSNFPAIQPVSGSVTVSNLPAEQLVAGENSNFVFYPTAANNTVSIYADGTQGVNVAGGWQYANINNVGKINWYCYASPTPATDYKVSQLTSMYTVINQQSNLGLATAQNPFIIIYTRPDSGTNSGGTFYKSKLFFGSNAHTDTLGLKLLYTGADPVDIHPEITGINRIQLLFVSALSNNKLLADVQNESIYLGTLQTTNNTSPANSFSFTMQEFGADWVKAPAVLPIEHGTVVVSGTVAMINQTEIHPFTYATITGSSYTLDTVDVRAYSTFDIYLSASSVNLTGNMSFDVQYSPDGSTWFSSSQIITLTNTQLQGLVLGNVTATSYVRLYYSTINTPTDIATSVKYWVTAKSL